MVWESDHNVHQVKETGQFYTANVKQTVQSVSVDVLGSTALVGQDVYAKPSLCQNLHSATDNGPSILDHPWHLRNCKLSPLAIIDPLST